ncbi:exodeoxyribonuclease VII small subunit [Ornithinimicrobium cerasi]|uniref:Exodeoxyribonuclease 7 small subunit n=1 Tax=Ornithinimicrobium cerasi TaxID=2248773 RepID=A0A285VUS3_9MICO|nr:exodeoxyribonuclease VII small subunit [Ornithinimicrobium cerasi]SOC57782.1 Exodeoxyribonuclease VII small subunit [Ornithinimicrobium cerasi]
MSQTTPPQDETVPVAGLSYEQARDELVGLVARIESGQVPLEESMLLWERGEALAAHCQAKLDAAQATLDRATGEDAASRAADADDEPEGDAAG